MKHLKFVIALFISMALILSCKPKEKKSDVFKPDTGKKSISQVLTASEIEAIEGNLNFSSTVEERVAAANQKRKKAPSSVTVSATIKILNNNGGGSFSIDYGGATNVIWHFFRGGDSLAANGAVYPTASQSFYLNPVTTFTSNFSRTFYQSVVVTGSLQPDSNGVVGADWVITYSNVVN